MNGSFTTSISVHVSTWGNAELPIVQEAAIAHILQSFIAYKPCTASRSRALVTWGGETASDVQVHEDVQPHVDVQAHVDVQPHAGVPIGCGLLDVQ